MADHAQLAQIMNKSFEKIITIIKSLNLKNWLEFSSHSKLYCTCAEGKIIEIWPDGDMMSWMGNNRGLLSRKETQFYETTRSR